MRYFRSPRPNRNNQMWAWDPNTERAIWLHYDGTFDSHSNFELAAFIEDVKRGTWYECDAQGNKVVTPEVETPEQRAARVKRETRDSINNELGADVFSRLSVVESALESREWPKVREEITSLLTFIPEPPPTFSYYKNTSKDSTRCVWIKGWRKNNVTGSFECLNRDGSWSPSGWSGPEDLADSHYSFIKVPNESDLHTPTPAPRALPYIYYKNTGENKSFVGGWRLAYATGKLECWDISRKRWGPSIYDSIEDIPKFCYTPVLVSSESDVTSIPSTPFYRFFRCGSNDPLLAPHYWRLNVDTGFLENKGSIDSDWAPSIFRTIEDLKASNWAEPIEVEFDPSTAPAPVYRYFVSRESLYSDVVWRFNRETHVLQCSPIQGGPGSNWYKSMYNDLGGPAGRH